MDYTIALDKNNYVFVNDGATVQSNVIYIPVGQTALVSLFNMTSVAKLEGNTLASDTCLTVKKLSFGRTGDIMEKVVDMCRDSISLTALHTQLLTARRVFSEPVYQGCCEWSIDPANNFALIPVPGFYVLETQAVDQLDTMYVEYALIPANQATAIPDGFKLGV